MALFGKFKAGVGAGSIPLAAVMPDDNPILRMLLASSSPTVAAAQPAQAPAAVPAAAAQPIPAQAPTAAPPVQQSAKGPSFLRILDGVLGGNTVTEVKDAYRAQQIAQQRKAQLDALAGQVITDPREMMVYQADPEQWAKANASRLEAYTLSPGAKRAVGGQQIDYAPQQFQMGDQLVQTTPQGGAQSIFTRAPTFAEQNTREKTLAEIQNMIDRLGLDREQLAEAIRNHRATEAIGQGNLGVRRNEYEARLRGVGGFGTPGVGNVLGSSLGPDWEVQP
jgi:hypothetical protein